MDDGRFDAMARVLGSGAPRRRVLAGLLASLSLALGDDAFAKKCKKGKKKCGNQCIPKADCCTDAECKGTGRKCRNGRCTNSGCGLTCGERQCGPHPCGGPVPCGVCNQFPNSFCTDEGLCDCEPDCEQKNCGSNGCGGSCGSCQNGTCSGSGQCVCAQGDPCGPDGNICCLTGTTCREDGSACCRTSCAGRCGVHHDTCSGEPLDCGDCPRELVCSDLANGGTCGCPQRRRGGVEAEILGCDGF